MEAYPQLDAAEQQRLAETVRLGRAAEAELAHLPARRRSAAEAQIREGRRAGELLVGATWRLVLLICREKAEERLGRDRALDRLPDLLAEGNVALAEAVATYDPALSPTFAMYAGRKVRDRVTAVLNSSSELTVSASWGRLKRIAAVRIPELEARLGRKATTEEIQADLLGACLDWAAKRLEPGQEMLPDEERTKLMMARLRKQGMLAAIEQINDVLTATQGLAYLDAPVAGDDGTATLGDLTLGDSASSDAFDQVERDEMRRDVVAAISALPEREQRIIACRYGFVDGEVWTYPRIAEEFGVTAERIRQIERAVLDKLRSPHGAYASLATHLYDQFD